jgi:hypothetical protein
MFVKEIIPVYSENHLKPINILWGQNAEFFTVKAGGTCSYHYALKGYWASRKTLTQIILIGIE